MRSLFRGITAALFTLAMASAHAAPEISAKDAQRDLRLLQRAFTELHPGLYRYAAPADLTAEFAAATAAVAQGASRAQMYLLASRLAAAVRCGHTWTNPSNQSNAVTQAVFKQADKLPFTLRWVQGRALVTGSVDAAVPTSSELLAIDGRPVAEIATALLPYLRADGNSPDADSKRLAQLDSDENGGAMDRLFPALFPPQNGRFRLTLREREATEPREVQVNGITLEVRARTLPLAATDWQFKITGDTAVLTLPTFAFWRGGFDAQGFLDRSFAALRTQPGGVPFLVIDIRRNEGGDDAIGRAVLAHLLKAPATQPGYRVESAYERAPYALARYLDTWDFSFFDRTGQVTKTAGRNWRLPDLAPRRIDPVAAPYASDVGRTVVLIGPQNSSAGFLLARDIKASRAAMLLGRPTAGNLRGLNGGQLAWFTLPASGVAVDIPLIASFAVAKSGAKSESGQAGQASESGPSGDPGEPPDAGVQPDVAAPPRWADAVAGIDTEMVAAQALIARWRALR